MTNDSEVPIHRLRAVAEGDFLHGREFAFGRVAPGEAKTFEVTTWPALWLHSRTEEVTWKFEAQSGPVPPDLVGRLRITEVPHPRFALAYQVIDDGSGESVGNGDGLLQRGEKVDLLVTVENVGDGATADLWKAERGLLDAQEDADGDGRADDPSAFVRLRNGSGVHSDTRYPNQQHTTPREMLPHRHLFLGSDCRHKLSHFSRTFFRELFGIVILPQRFQQGRPTMDVREQVPTVGLERHAMGQRQHIKGHVVRR